MRSSEENDKAVKIISILVERGFVPNKVECGLRYYNLFRAAFEIIDLMEGESEDR